MQMSTIAVLALACVACSAFAFTGQARWSDALPRPVYKTLERVTVQSPWFDVYRVSPGVTAFYEPGHFEEVLSYLIEGRDRAMLFDTGMGIGNLKAVVDHLTRKPILVVNSHSHFDHTGGDTYYSDIAVYDCAFSRERLARGVPDLSPQINAESVVKALPPGFDPKTYHRDPIRPTRFLRDGEIIDLGGRTLEVVFTPGHTPDSLCLLDRSNRTIFTGDTIYPATLYAHTADANLDDYVRSSARLAALEPLVDRVCPGHNEARTDPSILGRVSRAFAAIQAGTAASKPERDGVIRYEAGGIEILAKSR